MKMTVTIYHTTSPITKDLEFIPISDRYAHVKIDGVDYNVQIEDIVRLSAALSSYKEPVIYNTCNCK